MKRLAAALAVAAAVLASPAGSTYAAQPKTYQVTGPVLDVTADTITVEKGKEKWEIAVGADTKGASGVKKGDKVTVEYRMSAASVEVKPAGKAKK